MPIGDEYSQMRREWKSKPKVEKLKARYAVALECLVALKDIELMYMNALAEWMEAVKDSEDQITPEADAKLEQAIFLIEQLISSGTNGHGQTKSRLRRCLNRAAVILGRTPNITVTFGGEDYQRKRLLASFGILPSLNRMKRPERE